MVADKNNTHNSRIREGDDGGGVDGRGGGGMVGMEDSGGVWL